MSFLRSPGRAVLWLVRVQWLSGIIRGPDSFRVFLPIHLLLWVFILLIMHNMHHDGAYWWCSKMEATCPDIVHLHDNVQRPEGKRLCISLSRRCSFFPEAPQWTSPTCLLLEDFKCPFLNRLLTWRMALLKKWPKVIQIPLLRWEHPWKHIAFHYPNRLVL